MSQTIVVINIALLAVFLVSSPPMKIGGGHFLVPVGGLPFHMDNGGTSSYGGMHHMSQN